MSMGRVLNSTVAAIGGNPWRLLAIAFLLGGLPSALIAYAQQVAQVQAVAGRISLLTLYGVILSGLVVNVVLSVLMQGALVRAALTATEGRKASVVESLATALVRLLPLIGLAIVVGLSVWLAALLLLVPGIILYQIWAVSAPVVVAERRGVFDAMGRSAELTKGARWQVFALNLLVLILVMALGSVASGAYVAIYGLQAMAQTAENGVPLGFLVINAIPQTLAAVVMGTMPSALYAELRLWKDGSSSSALGDIFA